MLYPLFGYCKDKCGQFSSIFDDIHENSFWSSVRGVDSQIRTFQLNESVDAWPDEALVVSTRLKFWLTDYQSKKGVNFEFEIENEAHSNRCVWNLECRDLEYREEYFGQDLDVVKKIFNGIIRRMMLKLSEISDAGKDEG